MLGDTTALLTLVIGVVMYVMDVHGVATSFLQLADVCLVCLQDCLVLLGLLMLMFETVLPLTVKVMFCAVPGQLGQAQNLHCYCMCSGYASQTAAPLTLI